jgi:serine/threonine-protein kinase
MSTVLGTTLSGRYRLEARIGSGGMSTVYRAVDETLERPVAIKLMNREVARDSDLLERFRREARAVAQLSHPNIVGVIDAGDDLDPNYPRPYIVFEYVEGETLMSESGDSGSCRSRRPSRMRSRSGGPSAPHTRATSCTATSSPRTS